LAGTFSTKTSEPVAEPGKGPTTGGGRRKGVGSREIGLKKQKQVKAAAGGERPAGMECASRVKAATGSQSVAGKECNPGKKAATGGLRAVGMECPPREKADTGGDNTAGKECPHEEKAAAGRQSAAGEECASDCDGREEADLEGLYSVRGKGKIVGPELAPEYLAAVAGSPVVMKGAEQFGTKGKEQPFEWGDEQIWPGLAPEYREAVVELLEEFRESFAWSIHELSDTSIEGVEFEVNFTDNKVIWSPRRRQSPAEYELLKAYCEERCAAKLICRLKLP
jgi:hypothetical protein